MKWLEFLIIMVCIVSGLIFLDSKIYDNNLLIEQLRIDMLLERGIESQAVFDYSRTGTRNTCSRGQLCVIDVVTRRSYLLASCGIPPRTHVSRHIIAHNSLKLIPISFGPRPSYVTQIDDTWFSASASFVVPDDIDPGLYFFIPTIDWSDSDVTACRALGTTTYPAIAFNLL